MNIRYVMFNPPRESPAIYWTNGHVPIEKFIFLFGDMEVAMQIHSSNIKHGWATYKLSSIGIYLSDCPQENFEPITYWISAEPQERLAQPAERVAV